MHVGQCWRFPVKSMQGLPVDVLEIDDSGVRGDRRWAVIDTSTGKLGSAKRFSALLHASATDTEALLPDGTRISLDEEGPSPERNRLVSEWLGGSFELIPAQPTTSVVYEMTFDPPNDDADLIDIPSPVGTFLDLSAVHVVTTATLDGCRRLRPDLDWDVRRFRPNLLLDVESMEPFVEQSWIGGTICIGAVELRVDMPTVRCAMPLRAQPGLEREAALFAAMSELNTAAPNHLGVYCSVVAPGTVRTGDVVSVTAPAS